jgi:hypothetical protein
MTHDPSLIVSVIFLIASCVILLIIDRTEVRT